MATTNENNGVFETDLNSIGASYGDSSIIVENKRSADAVCGIAEIYGVKTSIEAAIVNDEPKIKVIFHGADDDQLDQIEQKIKISDWSINVVSVVRRVKNGVTNMGDFTLNGALVPAAGAAYEAAARTANIAGTAAVRLGAIVTSSTIKEGRMAVKRLATDPVVWEAAGTVKELGSDIKSGLGKLFSSLSKNGNSKINRHNG